VTNHIEVLPLSPSDDGIRLAVYEAIYGVNSPLFRYRGRTSPPVHILVDRGRVTLKGSVTTQVDRQVIVAKAQSIPGVFDVENAIELEEEA
jgi:hyperosmotically inducible protein